MQNLKSGLLIFQVDVPTTELNQLTGIAAILTYPLDIEMVQEEEKMMAEEKRLKQQALNS